MSGRKTKALPLEWKPHWFQEEGPREEAIAITDTYQVSEEGWWHPLGRLHPCDSMDAAKAAAQADWDEQTAKIIPPISLQDAALVLSDFIHSDMLTANRLMATFEATGETPVRHWLVNLICALAEIPENERPLPTART